MNLSEPFIRRPVMTTLVMFACVIFGLVCYRLLPVASNPPIQLPVILVTTNYPGASPNEVARLIASPLERQFILMQGIEIVASDNNYEQSNILLQFHLGTDINVAAQEVEEAINMAMAQLPKDLPQNPTYVKSNPTDTPILYLVAYSDTMTEGQIYEYGYTVLGQQLGTINGVADIQLFGQPYAVRAKIDPQSIAAKNMTLAQIANTINVENPDQPSGKLYGKYRSMGLISKGQLLQAEKYNNLILKYEDGQPVRLKDVGYAYDSVLNDKQNFRWQTKAKNTPMLVLALHRELGFNTVQVCDAIVDRVAKLKQQLPGSLQVEIPFNQAVWIRQSIADVELTLLVAFILVVCVVYLYLGKMRNSFIPLITLPITLAGTMIFMYFLGYSLDILSLSALTLSIGFLVDDAIVVLENITRWIQGGEKPFNAALKGSSQISVTILSISLSLAAAFIPMLLLGGVTGKLFHEFAGTILTAILFSGFISLTLTPMLSSRMIPPYEKEKESKMERFSNRLNETLIRWYKLPLKWVLNHKSVTLCIALFIVGASGYLFFILPKSFLPPVDLGVIQMFVQTKQGTSPEQMTKYNDYLRKMCIENPAVKEVGQIQSYPTDNQSLYFVMLEDPKKRQDIWTVMKELQERFSQVVGTKVFLRAFPLINLQVGDIESGKAQYQYILQGFQSDVLYAEAEKFVGLLQTLPELTNVSSDLQAASPSIEISLLRDPAHSYGNLNATDIENALQYAYGETYISKINKPENMYYVIVEAEDPYQRDKQDFNTLYAQNKDGAVAIESLIEVKEITTPLTINHINALPSVTISFDPADNVAISTAVQAIENAAQGHLSKSIVANPAGNTVAFQQTMQQLFVLLVMAVFVIYLILGILYEDFLHPFTALSAIPVAALGALLTLIFINESLSIYAFIGIIMLLGIVMKNGILIVDFALENMQKKQISSFDAIFEACIIRFRPILMTTFAAMMGAVPIALGVGGTVAQGRAPLGIVIVGGLIFSQAVTLFLTPVIFLITCKSKEKFSKIKT